MVHVSTDAVFDGSKRVPYTESDPANPASVYGRTKLRAERFILQRPESWAFRVSILFGPEEKSHPGKLPGNFISKGLSKIAAGEAFVVAADQLGTATYTIDAAEKMMKVVESGRFGLYHLSNSGACNRLDSCPRIL